MISIIVPYRDRPEHLARFISAMKMNRQEKEIIIIEQSARHNFNRGKLLNVGAIHADGDILIFHDVDMIPLFERYPDDANTIIQLKSSEIQKENYLGGVTLFPRDIFFKAAGGYSNKFYSRAEDNEMMFNLKRNNIPWIEYFHPFLELNHKRPDVEFDESLWKRAQMSRPIDDGANHCLYYLKSSTIQSGRELFIRHLIVEI